MKDIVKKTLEEIKKEKIHPTEKWKFTARNVLVWLMLAGLIILGSASIGLMIYLMIDLDWDLYNYFRHDRIKIFLHMVPFFWLFLFLFFLALSFLIFRKTKNGYRYNGFLVGLVLLASLFSLGLALHFAKTTPQLHKQIFRNIPQYRVMCHNKEDLWSLPELGLLGGEVIEVKDKSFDLKDFRGTYWLVDYDNETVMRPSVNLTPQEKVKLIGKKEEEKVFKALEIRPWKAGMERGKREMEEDE